MKSNRAFLVAWFGHPKATANDHIPFGIRSGALIRCDSGCVNMTALADRKNKPIKTIRYLCGIILPH
jgi:hypothetical protein